MKKISDALVTASFIISLNQIALGQDEFELKLPSEIPSPISHVFVPYGFDDNDGVEVVLQGVFPNTCYRVNRAVDVVDHEKREITIYATSLYYESAENICIQVQVPFLQVVRLGVMLEGEYDIKVAEVDDVKGKLWVARATTSKPDDYLYAPVHNASLSMESEKQLVTIDGEYPLLLVGCAYMSSVHIRRELAEVITVQPVMAISYDRSFCKKIGLKFAIKTPVPEDKVFTGEGIIHVRTMNGDSLNRYVKN